MAKNAIKKGIIMFKKLVISLSILAIFSGVNIGHVLAVSNPYNKYQNLQGVKSVACTWGAWQAAYDRMGVALPSWGNAINWYNKAKKAGYSVGKEYKPNSIAVFSGAWGYGHVAYIVEQHEKCKYGYCDTISTTIEGGQIYAYSDVNGEPLLDENGKASYYAAFDEGYCNTCEKWNYTTVSNFIGYIYLDDAPKTPVTTTKKTTTKTTTSTTTTKALSNNNYLKSLTLDKADISFDKMTNVYTVNVANNVDSITVSGKAEDEKATTDGLTTYALNVGENKIVITVKAEDGSTNNYEVMVIREQETMTSMQSLKEKTNNKSKFVTPKVIILCGVFAVIIVVSIILIIVKKHK